MSLTRTAQAAFLVLLIALLSIAAIADVTISGVVHDVEGQPLKQIVVAGANLNNTTYVAFPEPDPDGNSYRPGPGREVFGGIEIRF
jgi:hypothetical protein